MVPPSSSSKSKTQKTIRGDTLRKQKAGYEQQLYALEQKIARSREANKLFGKYRPGGYAAGAAEIANMTFKKGELKRKIEAKQGEIDANDQKISDYKSAIATTKQNQATATNRANLIQSGGMLKTQDALRTGKEIAKGFFDALNFDALGPVFSTLGANLAKGFKDAGGLNEIKFRIQGLSSKEIKLEERFKEQKALLAAQDRASKALNRGGESSGPSNVNLSEDSIRKLADAIVNSKRD